MSKRLFIILPLTVIILSPLLLVLGDYFLSTTPWNQDDPLPAGENQQAIRFQRDALTLQKLKTATAKSLLEETRAAQKTADVAKDALRGQAFWWGMIISAIAFCAVVCVGLAGSIVNIFWRNSAIVAQWFSQRVLPASAYALESNLARERMLYYRNEQNQILEPPIDLHALPQPTAEPLTAMQCLQRGLVSGQNHEFFFGTTNDGQYVYEDLQPEGVGFYHVGLIGEGRIGKSNALVNFGAQAEMKGQLILAIDLHYPNKESFTEKFGELAKTPNFKGFHNIQDALKAIYFLETTLDGRLTGAMPSTPGIIIVCDELKNFMRQIKRLGEEFFAHVVSVLERVTEEGGKNNISFIVASHTWRAEDLGTTAWRDLLNFRVGLRSTPRQAQTFGIEKERKNQFKALKPGEIIYEDAGGQYHQCQVPLWTQEAIARAASMVTHAEWPDIQEPEPHELTEYRKNVVNLESARKLKQIETLKDCYAHGKGVEWAKKTGISQHEIGRIINGKCMPQEATLTKLLEVANDD